MEESFVSPSSFTISEKSDVLLKLVDFLLVV